MVAKPVANCPNTDELRAFQAKQLSGLVGQAVHLHVQQCPRCQETLTDLRNTVSLNANASLETPVPQPTLSIKSSPGLPAFPFLRPAQQSDEIGRLGNYRVLQLLDRGGMAFVFHAEDISLCRPVALKVMRPDAQEDVSAFDRFLREARLLASVKHDHLVTVYQAGREENTVYLAMELLQGASLESWIRQHPTPEFAQLRRLSLEIASGIDAIHRHGLIHRDIKPSNIWVEAPSNRVKILDFGLARLVRDEVRLTQTGVILGTVQYMAPEQARGGAVDARSDLFSLGCVLYNLATGERPFDGEETLAILTALAVHPPKPIHLLNPTLPKEYADLVMQLLEKDPKNRPPSAQAVIDRLERLPFDLPSTMVKPLPIRAVTLPPTQVFTPAQTPTGVRRAAPAWKMWASIGLLAFFAVVASAVAVKFWPGKAPQAKATSEPKRTPTPSPPSAVADTVYLFDLKELRAENWPFFGEEKKPEGKKPPPEGKKKEEKKQPETKKGPPSFRNLVLSVQGEKSPKGIFMHPPPPDGGAVSITYALDGEYSTFVTEVSLNDTAPPMIEEEPLEFAVFGDDKLLWRSKKVWSQLDADPCQVSVKGVRELKIEMVRAGEPKGAHGVWIEPRLTK